MGRDHRCMHFARSAATALYILLLPALLVTTNVRWMAGDVKLYERGFREYGAEEATGVPLYELDRAAQEMVNYFENDVAELRIVVSEQEREAPLFNEQEIAHMEDVKTLMRAVFRLNEISLAFVILYIGGVVLWSRERSLRRLAKESLAGIGVGFALLAGVGVFAVTGFDAFWTKFHEIAFQNDLWQLNPDTDRLIQMFPEEFWQEATYLLGIATLIEVVAVVLVSLAYLVFARGERPGPPKPERITPDANPLKEAAG